MTSTFIECGNHLNGKSQGENGAIQFKSSSNDGLDLFFTLIRDCDTQQLESQLEKCIESDNPNEIADLFVLTFQTRNCRGGKGERKLFHVMITTLFKFYPETVINLLKLVPHYGYYKDYVFLLDMTYKNPFYKRFQEKIVDIIVEQLQADLTELDVSQVESRIPKLSLVAKYAPRPNKHYRRIAKLIYRKMYPCDIKAEENYRKKLAIINKVLSTTEVNMCAKGYSQIQYSRVPSICLLKWRKAFLNERSNCPDSFFETGNRYPEDVDRVTSRNNLKEALKNKSISGKQLMPHEVVKEFMKNETTSIEEELLTQQWEKMKEQVLLMIQSKNENGLNLKNLVPLVDVSSSMNGLPMEVAISLGILVSEVTNPLFRDTFISFSTTPEWISLKGLTLKKKFLRISKTSRRTFPLVPTKNVAQGKSYQYLLKYIVYPFDL